MRRAHLNLVSLGGRTPPTEIRIFKTGKVLTTKGTFLFDDKAGASVMKAWTSYGNDLCFDYEHQAVNPDARAGEGKSAGWFKLELRADGLYAVGIKWTDQAASQIAKAEWRYFSPTFDYDPKTGRILELVNVALTNIPATKNLPALVAAQKEKPSMSTTKKAPKNIMKPKTKSEIAQERLAAKSAKAESTDDAEMDELEADDADLDEVDAADDDTADMADDDVEAADDDADMADDDDDDDADADDADMDDADTAKAKKMKKTAKTSISERAALTALREVTGKVNLSEAIGALRGIALARAELSAVKKQVEMLNRARRGDRVKTMVEAAIKCGKLTPAQRDSHMKIGMRDPRELKGMLGEMSKRVRMDDDGALRESNAAGGGAETLSTEERRVARKSGAVEADGSLLYEKAKAAGKILSLDRFLTSDEN